jgi:hypothetical protein
LCHQFYTVRHFSILLQLIFSSFWNFYIINKIASNYVQSILRLIAVYFQRKEIYSWRCFHCDSICGEFLSMHYIRGSLSLLLIFPIHACPFFRSEIKSVEIGPANKSIFHNCDRHMQAISHSARTIIINIAAPPLDVTLNKPNHFPLAISLSLLLGARAREQAGVGLRINALFHSLLSHTRYHYTICILSPEGPTPPDLFL